MSSFVCLPADLLFNISGLVDITVFYISVSIMSDQIAYLCCIREKQKWYYLWHTS